MAYLVIPFFTWAALRFGMLTVAVLSMVVAFLSTYVTWAGDGPFVQAEGSRQHAVTLLQMFLVVTVSTAFILAALVSDLRDGRQVEAELRHRASHDPLTGLPNRALLAETLDGALGARPGYGEEVALLVCDVDHFKRVNDTYGHSVGDLLLVELARRLRQSVRVEDLVARISGDEFVVLLARADPLAVDAVCERILTTVGRPVRVTESGSSREIEASLSVGLAVAGPGTTATHLFAAADMALYEAKRRGRGQVARADERLLSEVRERVDVERDVSSRTLAEGLVCLYQPQVEAATGRLFGLRARPHWQHATWGLLGEDRLLPAVESSGRRAELFSEVLDQALEAQRGWRSDNGRAPAVAVEIGASQLADPGLPERVTAALLRAGTHACDVWVEVRHGAPFDDAALAGLGRLREVGVRLAVTGFGTGWSGMGLLSNHQWDLLRLHHSFVAALGADDQREAVVAATVSMAHALGVCVAADGVSTLDQLERLATLGCDVVQGDLLGRPVPASDAVDLVDPRPSAGDRDREAPRA
jgi:diguanylate cyclase (GGDEF)-like protein